MLHHLRLLFEWTCILVVVWYGVAWVAGAIVGANVYA